MKKHFQSHFGLILSGNLAEKLAEYILLSIPFWSDFISFYDMLSTTFQTRTFNPILVWFYLYVFVFSSQYEIHFQSHFGLILSKLKFREDNVADFFQSHFGLILSSFFCFGLFNCVSSFNPILVWFYHRKRVVLKMDFDILSIPFWSDFISK